MEATSLYLVLTELLLAFFGGVYFFYCVSSKRQILSDAILFVALLTVTSALGFVLEDDSSRWISVKIGLFVCCLYLSSQYPRQAMLLLAILASTGFLLDGVIAGKYFLKQVGVNANQLMLIPFTLIACALILFRRDKHINIWLLYLVVGVEIICAFDFDVRTGIINSILILILMGSVKASRLFLRYGKWIPFLYLIIVIISYYSLLFKINLVPASASNMERSSMILAAISHFFDYLFVGPRREFDDIAGAAANALNWQLYKSDKGVDPHCFLLSLWRDAGAILTLLWVTAWFYYWSRLNKLIIHINNARIRVALAVLAIGVVQFSIAPPSTGTRLLVALIMGAALGFAKQQSSAEFHQGYASDGHSVQAK